MSPRGYCQECGGEYAVFGNGTRIARHGFSRHHGRECPGSRKAPDDTKNPGHRGPGSIEDDGSNESPL